MTATTLPPLTRAHLSDVDTSNVEVPDERLLELPERIVQFGTGNFLRGFVDDFIHRANREGRYAGRIVAIGSTGSARDAGLREQDGLYTLCVAGIENGEPQEKCRIISSLSRVISANQDWDDVLALARQPELDFIFSNTTEVGIVKDEHSRFNDSPPASFPAKLTRFLFERASTFDFDGKKAPVVIPCELIEQNGATLRGIVLSIAERWKLEPRFAAWIETSVLFLDTLVDRIVPGSPAEHDEERLREVLGYEDAMLTCCEPYRLFAIQGGDAVRARLPWAVGDKGVVVAPDITPYRKRKVHLLNGAHTLLVNIALPLGFDTVRDAVEAPLIRKYLHRAMLDEIVPCIDVEGGRTFADEVLDRFRNPYIRHALVDITLQSVMKMRVRVVPLIGEYVARFDELPAALTFGIAAFMHFMRGEFHDARTARGLSMPADNQAADLRAHWQKAEEQILRSAQDDNRAREPKATRKPRATLSSSREPKATEGSAFDVTSNAVTAICADTSLWGTDLNAIPHFTDAVTKHVQEIETLGMTKALSHLVETF